MKYADLLKHFILEGYKFDKNPSKAFNTKLYKKYHLNNSNDINPLYHYLINKKQNCIDWDILKLKDNELFDESYYLSNYKDVRDSGVNPLFHFVHDGWKELRDPNPLFNTKYYLDSNYDVREYGINPLIHFIEYGWKEGRNPSEEFNTNYYISKYEDIRKANINPLWHYYVYGKKELRFKSEIDYIKKTSKKEYEYNSPILTNEIQNEIDDFSQKPLISIVMPVYNVEAKWLDLAIKSLESQWYSNWELCIADDKSTSFETINYLENIKNSKIKISFLKQNLNISGASNAALKIANGEYIALMDNDDELTCDALYQVVKAINLYAAEFIYSDEDKLQLNGQFCDPHLNLIFQKRCFIAKII